MKKFILILFSFTNCFTIPIEVAINRLPSRWAHTPAERYLAIQLRQAERDSQLNNSNQASTTAISILSVQRINPPSSLSLGQRLAAMTQEERARAIESLVPEQQQEQVSLDQISEIPER